MRCTADKLTIFLFLNFPSMRKENFPQQQEPRQHQQQQQQQQHRQSVNEKRNEKHNVLWLFL